MYERPDAGRPRGRAKGPGRGCQRRKGFVNVSAILRGDVRPLGIRAGAARRARPQGARAGFGGWQTGGKRDLSHWRSLVTPLIRPGTTLRHPSYGCADPRGGRGLHPGHDHGRRQPVAGRQRLLPRADLPTPRLIKLDELGRQPIGLAASYAGLAGPTEDQASDVPGLVATAIRDFVRDRPGTSRRSWRARPTRGFGITIRCGGDRGSSKLLTLPPSRPRLHLTF
jgi:hypothetical protein